MKLSDIAKKMILFMCALLLVLITIGIVYYRSIAVLPFAAGAFLGVSLNVLKVIMLDRTAKKVVDMEAANAANYVRVQHLFRFLLTGLVLILSALVPSINIYGAALGVLTFQISLFFMKHSFTKDTNI